MTYTLEDFDKEFQIDPKEIAKYTQQIRDEIRRYELRDARKELGLSAGTPFANPGSVKGS